MSDCSLKASKQYVQLYHVENKLQERYNLEHYIHNIFILHDTVVIFVVLVPLKRVDSLNQHLNIRLYTTVQSDLSI